MTLFCGLGLIWLAIALLLAGLFRLTGMYKDQATSAGQEAVYCFLGGIIVGAVLLLIFVLLAAGVGLIAKGVRA